MIIGIQIGILLLLAFGVFQTKNYKKDWLSTLQVKKSKITILYPISLFLYEKLFIRIKHQRQGHIKEVVREIQITGNKEDNYVLYCINKIATTLLVLITFISISILYDLFGGTDTILKNQRYLVRPKYGEGSHSINLDLKLPKQDKTEYTINIKERQYSGEELEEVMAKVKEYIDRTVLGENQSVDNINLPLHLIKRIPGTSFQVSWELDDTNVIMRDGTLKNEFIGEDGQIVLLTAIITYYDYKEDYTIPFRILPKLVSKEEQMQEKINQAIEEAQQSSKTEKYVALPVEVEEQSIYWSEKKDNTARNLFLFGLLLTVLIPTILDQSLEKQKRQRELQLMIDYPEFINKITLLLGAGMTIKKAWERIAVEYKEKKEAYIKVENNKHKRTKPKVYERYCYEEVLVTYNELSNGLTEQKAYENFGKRIHLLPYLKFSSLITQNLKKGTKGLLDLLELEALEAFEERKQLAKRLGEEAGTKLLIPMMFMFAIVLFIILVPAFRSFRL